MELVSEFLSNFWHFTSLISFYIIFGLIIAGIIKQIIPDSFIQKHIGENSTSSIFKAALLGTPLPLCSCSVIPFVSSLQKSGASKSALQTFLISTPITGVDSIMATYGAFGLFFTMYRVITSIVIAIIAGFLSMIFIKEQKQIKNNLWTTNKPTVKEPIISLHVKEKAPFLDRVFDYAFNQLFSGIAKSLLIGIILGSLLSTFIPTDMTSLLSDNLFLSYIFVLLIAMPLYVCAITSIPIGITLILTGFSPGAAFVFLTAGPATNLVTISVIQKILGKKSTVIYISSVILGTTFFAYIMDTVFLNFLSSTINSVSAEEDASLLEAIFSVIMLGLMYKYIKPHKKTKSCCS
ncbi:SO_0444 family Cu/Zn efflux transporter [Sulfurospirillum arcachonense]|uniref:SO_0444 family Cu/Zn efflux transporter n=1 Tax=Sulfurospirillum arcachonense TaxID=57666 RepID=UPI00046822A3|nr:SO_0444 family Cu/Zn efflux transporter [Sulfurospirillum arcachonense]